MFTKDYFLIIHLIIKNKYLVFIIGASSANVFHRTTLAPLTSQRQSASAEISRAVNPKIHFDCATRFHTNELKAFALRQLERMVT